MSKNQMVLPSVLAFNRGVVVTDARMLNVFPDGETTPVNVVRHGVVGTQNTAKEASGKSTTKVANLQETDSAKVDVGAVALRVEFELRFLPLTNALNMCRDAKNAKNEAALRSGLDTFLSKATASEGLLEVAHRYVRNMVNGRWLWRNRAEAMSVTVKVVLKGISYSFDALSYSLNQFDNYSNEEKILANAMVDSMTSDVTLRQTFEVSADVDFGTKGGNEVYPSQVYISGKPAGFAKVLYRYGMAERSSNTSGARCMGFAAIRDQKVGNALRTFDTWYPTDYFKSETGQKSDTIVPIAIEPNGANLTYMKVFRIKEASAFTMLGHIGEIDPDSENGMFLLACLIRGGVYGNDGSDVVKAKGGDEAEAEVKE